MSVFHHLAIRGAHGTDELVQPYGGICRCQVQQQWHAGDYYPCIPVTAHAVHAEEPAWLLHGRLPAHPLPGACLRWPECLSCDPQAPAASRGRGHPWQQLLWCCLNLAGLLAAAASRRRYSVPLQKNDCAHRAIRAVAELLLNCWIRSRRKPKGEEGRK